MHVCVCVCVNGGFYCKKHNMHFPQQQTYPHQAKRYVKYTQNIFAFSMENIYRNNRNSNFWIFSVLYFSTRFGLLRFYVFVAFSRYAVGLSLIPLDCIFFIWTINTSVHSAYFTEHFSPSKNNREKNLLFSQWNIVQARNIWSHIEYFNPFYAIMQIWCLKIKVCANFIFFLLLILLNIANMLTSHMNKQNIFHNIFKYDFFLWGGKWLASIGMYWKIFT